VSYVEERLAPISRHWRRCLAECALGMGSQLSAHALCILAAVSNAALGGIALAFGHDFWSAFALGTTVYMLSIGARFAWTRGKYVPSLTMVALGLSLSLVAAFAINRVAVYGHRQELKIWYSQLAESDREAVRMRVRQWMEEQGEVKNASLRDTAQLLGYSHAEDYVLFNICSPSAGPLATISVNFGRE
jgi:hypothetical protein